MTGRTMVGVWFSALSLVAASILVLVAVAPRPLDRFVGVPTVVIGSSLTGYAVPERGDKTSSLLGDGRAHRRVAVKRASEDRLLDLLDEALYAHPALVLIEANPFLFSFADRRGERPCDGWVQAMRARIAQLHDFPVGAARRLAGLQGPDEFGELPLDRPQLIDPAALRRLYPLVLHEPCDIDRFAELVNRAKKQHTRVALLLLPRSPAAIAVVGARTDTAIGWHAEKLASRLGVTIVPLTGPWRNAEFVDQAHVNREGRRHVVADLRRWWQNAA